MGKQASISLLAFHLILSEIVQEISRESGVDEDEVYLSINWNENLNVEANQIKDEGTDEAARKAAR